MKKTIFKTLLMAGLGLTVTACTSNDDLVMDSPTASHSTNSKEASKTKTYQIRYGLVSQSGVKTLSGSYDLGGFVATNVVTGETYDSYGSSSGGFQTLPQFYDGLPEGTYTFTAMQGQGGWVGYGSVVGTVSDAQVDADGYVTIYVPIAWEE
ncbi:hypothetical protein [Chryseobacterium sp. Alg-005]|uniref:hypothetical protein n=1 Tax=Chryseobacterium sp. Alg-005 TaxID=3159516 RepID=UPI0036F2FB44